MEGPKANKQSILGILRYAAIAVCAIVVIYEGWKILSNRLENRRALNEYSSIFDETVTISEEEGTGIGEDAANPQYYPNLQIDYAKLKEINPDFVGWLYFPAVDTSYPVVKEKVKDEYLYKTFQGASNGAGAIFLDVWSNVRFEGLSNFIFGHNMMNRSMFGSLTLLNVEGNENLLNEEPYFYVYTEDMVYRYRAFAYYNCAEGGPVYVNVGEDVSKYDDVIAYIEENNQYECPDTYDFSERPEILSLSTCSDYGPLRFVVTGVRDYSWYLGEGERQTAEVIYRELAESYVTLNQSDDSSDNIEKVDFSGLRTVNEDTVAWLTFPALEMSYPVVRETEQNEYVSRNIHGEADTAGAIYTDLSSDEKLHGLSDFIYGHYLRDGSLFGALQKFFDEESLAQIEEDPYFYVRTEEGVRKYRVIAYCETTSEDDVYAIVDDNEGFYDLVVKHIEENHTLMEGFKDIDFEERPQLMTLSTCSDFGDKGRITVTGVLVED